MRESSRRLGRSGGGVRGLWSSYLRRRHSIAHDLSATSLCRYKPIWVF